MKYVYFTNSRKQKLCGIISEPKTNKTQNVVLMCHGLGSNKDDILYIALQDQINSYEIATFRIDLLGHGESDGEFNDLTLTETIDDILCAKRELERRGYSDIGFIGHSFGGVGGIMVASTEPFRFLVVISPPTYYDINEMIKSSVFILKELIIVNTNTEKKNAHPNVKFFRDYGSHDSYAAAEKISAPVLIIHGDKDKIVPLAKSQELNKRIKNSQIKIFKGADHQYTNVKEPLIEEIMKFVKIKI